MDYSALSVFSRYQPKYFGMSEYADVDNEAWFGPAVRWASAEGEDTNILSYEDAFSVSDWAMAAMQWACGAGVIQGSESGSTVYLLPGNSATRAQVATMIARFCTDVAK